ncbi:hypothetical protein LTR95_012867 [Oleoguttula sp. CCFEE 5521]
MAELDGVRASFYSSIETRKEHNMSPRHHFIFHFDFWCLAGKTSKPERQFTDPSVYATHHKQFEAAGLPSDQAGWIVRARRVAEILAQDAAARDIENKAPRAEISLLKSSALLKVLGPERYGGGGEAWDTAYKVIRELAKGDGSLGMLLGYHLLWSTTANVVRTEEQADSVQQAIVKNNYITSDGDSIIFSGAKNFNTGGVVSDLTVLEGVLEGTEDHIFTFVNTVQPGITFAHNWDSIGLRLTESDSVKIDNVKVPWTDALGWDAQTKRPIPDILRIAQGALAAATKYTVNGTRPWPYGGDNKDKAVDEWYIIERYGTYRAHLQAADALADRAGDEVTRLYRDAGQHGSTPIAGLDHRTSSNGSNGHSNGHVNGSKGTASGTRSSITAQRRGEVATLVASVKVVTTDTGLLVTNGIFEMLGARATCKKYGFYRFWHDIRTHSLHDPAAYKKREVGRYQLLDEVPEPTWYT